MAIPGNTPSLKLVARGAASLGRAVTGGLRLLPGTLLILPLVAVLVGTEWSIDTVTMPASVTLVTNPGQRSETTQRIDAFPNFVKEGSEWTKGFELRPNEALEMTFASPIQTFHLAVQADCNDQYRVFAAGGDRAFGEIWTILRAPTDALTTRHRSFSLDAPITVFRIAPKEGDDLYSVSGLRIETNRRLPHVVIAPLVWILFLVVWSLSRAGPTRRFGEWITRGWARADWIVATGAICSIVVHMDAASLLLILVAAGAWLLIALCRMGVRRFGLGPTLVNVATVVLIVWIGPILFDAIMMHRIGARFDLTVDHRMNPDRGEINSDGIRFKGEAEDVSPDDYNILFLGDSFTYGSLLRYDETVSVAFERLAVSGCSDKVRGFNLGWMSASPLLSYRLLVDIGKRYHPDLIVYLLDVTDYHNDLDYERSLRQESDVPVLGMSPTRAALEQILSRFFGAQTLNEFWSVLRPLTTKDPRAIEGLEVPGDRFFVVNQRLDTSREHIERGVMLNLARIHRYGSTVLNVPLAVVLVPRAFQYSSRESLDHWESKGYEIGGPHVRAPSEYFEEARGELGYPVLDLLPIFTRSEIFPLFFEADPHWNGRGALLAAEAIEGFLQRERRRPCR